VLTEKRNNKSLEGRSESAAEGEEGKGREKEGGSSVENVEKIGARKK